MHEIRDKIFLQDLVEVVPKLKIGVNQKKFFEVLKNVGVENESDLLHVQELDLAPGLFTKIQARKILGIWHKSKPICQKCYCNSCCKCICEVDLEVLIPF